MPGIKKAFAAMSAAALRDRHLHRQRPDRADPPERV